ncbi:MAG: hypothetical protein GX141_07540 [Armatimonadetes bacterium]|nr:hypothetical protein [Armatimonadota bacterium]
MAKICLIDTPVPVPAGADEDFATGGLARLRAWPCITTAQDHSRLDDNIAQRIE